MNILLTSVGRRSYMVDYFKEAIDNFGEIHVSNSHYTIAMESADKYIITPLVYDEKYISSLLNYCIDNSIGAILSLFDLDLLVLAENMELFKRNGISLILAPVTSILICNDKWETYNFLTKNNINTPKTFLSINTAIESINKGILAYPLVIKPRWGTGSLGIYFADNEEELKILYKKSKKIIFNSYLKYESSRTLMDPIIIQEYMDGQEYGLDVLNDLKNNYVQTYVKEKVEMREGETMIGKTVNNSPFEFIAMKLSMLMEHKGILSVDCFRTDNDIYVTEMNCRLSGHYPLSHLAGVNFPKQLLQWINGGETDKSLLICKEDIVIEKILTPRIVRVPSRDKNLEKR